MWKRSHSAQFSSCLFVHCRGSATLKYISEAAAILADCLHKKLARVHVSRHGNDGKDAIGEFWICGNNHKPKWKLIKKNPKTPSRYYVPWSFPLARHTQCLGIHYHTFEAQWREQLNCQIIWWTYGKGGKQCLVLSNWAPTQKHAPPCVACFSCVSRALPVGAKENWKHVSYLPQFASHSSSWTRCPFVDESLQGANFYLSAFSSPSTSRHSLAAAHLSSSLLRIEWKTVEWLYLSHTDGICIITAAHISVFQPF